MKKPCNGCTYSLERRTKQAIRHYPNSIKCIGCKNYINYLEYRKSKQKYCKGNQIKTVEEFEKHIPDGFMYWGDKVQHIGWLVSMQYRVIQNAIKSGFIYEAVLKRSKV